jgi:hypothetical protein
MIKKIKAAATPRPIKRLWLSSSKGRMGLRGSTSTTGQIHLTHFDLGLFEMTGQLTGYSGVSQSQVLYTGQNFEEK